MRAKMFGVCCVDGLGLENNKGYQVTKEIRERVLGIRLSGSDGSGYTDY